MRKLSVLFFLYILLSYNSKADYLVRVQFNFKKLAGHGVDMKFSIKDLFELEKFISCIDTLTENRMLTGLGIPLMPPFLEDSCQTPKYIEFQQEKFFEYRKRKSIIANNNYLNLKIFIIKCDYEICVERIYNKIFGDYSIKYDRVGTIISNPIIKPFTKREIAEIKKIKSLLNKLEGVPIKFLDSIWTGN